MRRGYTNGGSGRHKPLAEQNLTPPFSWPTDRNTPHPLPDPPPFHPHAPLPPLYPSQGKQSRLTPLKALRVSTVPWEHQNVEYAICIDDDVFDGPSPKEFPEAEQKEIGKSCDEQKSLILFS